MTLTPNFGVEEQENPTLEPLERHFSGKKADFRPPEGLFQPLAGASPASAVGVENGVIWVKKSTSTLWVHK